MAGGIHAGQSTHRKRTVTSMARDLPAIHLGIYTLSRRGGWLGTATSAYFTLLGVSFSRVNVRTHSLALVGSLVVVAGLVELLDIE